MSRLTIWMKDPQPLGLLCAGGAVALGCFYLIMAGAPGRHLAINGAALVVGLAAYATVVAPQWRLGPAGDAIIPALGAVLLGVALFGTPVEGAARWVSIGPLSLQLSLIVLPAMIAGFTRAPSASGAAGMMLAALALALQPDRGMAGVLAASLAVLAWLRPARAILATAAAALAGFAATLVQPDALPAVPYVDQIFYTSFSVHPLAGAAVVGGAVLLVLPAFLARGAGGTALMLFGATWGAVMLAAALGNYPTPLVGYGGSAIVGYLLSLALLPRVEAAGPVVASQGSEVAGPDSDTMFAAA